MKCNRNIFSLHIGFSTLLSIFFRIWMQNGNGYLENPISGGILGENRICLTWVIRTDKESRFAVSRLYRIQTPDKVMIVFVP